MRTTFDREIMNLLNDVNVMGTRVDRIIGNTYTAVKEKDFVLSKKIFEEDYKINNMEIAIEQSAISLIAFCTFSFKSLISTFTKPSSWREIIIVGPSAAFTMYKLPTRAIVAINAIDKIIFLIIIKILMKY